MNRLLIQLRLLEILLWIKWSYLIVLVQPHPQWCPMKCMMGVTCLTYISTMQPSARQWNIVQWWSSIILYLIQEGDCWQSILETTLLPQWRTRSWILYKSSAGSNWLSSSWIPTGQLDQSWLKWMGLRGELKFEGRIPLSRVAVDDTSVGGNGPAL